jgi:hypothetical protein
MLWRVFVSIIFNSKFFLNILRKITSKSIDIWLCNEFPFWQQQQKQWKSNILKGNTVLKNSLHGQIQSDFEKVSLEMSEKAWIFFKMGDKKILLDKYPAYAGKLKITKVNFLMNFVRSRSPQELEQKMFIWSLPSSKNLTTEPRSSFKN